MSTPSACLSYSLIIPLFKSEEGIDDLCDALKGLVREFPFQVVFVDDGSPDRSRAMVLERCKRSSWSWKVVCHARNFGSFEAIRTGFAEADGDFVAFMSADLQEPPELVLEIFKALAAERCDIALGRRVSRGDRRRDQVYSHLFWKLYRALVNPSIPEGGVDVFGCTRQVAQTLLAMRETHTSLLAQLFWVGYRREFIDYSRRKRSRGRSAWTFRKKLSYMSDSIFAFSDLPLRALTFLGVLGLIVTLLVALVTIIARLMDYIEVPGYTALILFLSGSTALILTGLGIVGGYVWRTYENSKHRPISIVSSIMRS